MSEQPSAIKHSTRPHILQPIQMRFSRVDNNLSVFSGWRPLSLLRKQVELKLLEVSIRKVSL